MGTLLLAAVLALQDDVDLADRLAERGEFDLAAEVYRRQAAPMRDYGLARLRVMAAQRDRKEKSTDEAIEAVRACLAAHPAHDRRTPLLTDLTAMLLQRGRLAAAAAPGRAEAAFAEAEKECEIRLRDNGLRRPESSNGGSSFEAWQAERIAAQLDLMDAMFARVAFRDAAAHRAVMREALKRLLAYFEATFRWDGYDHYLCYQATTTLVGRALHALAETTDPTADTWAACFRYIGQGRALLSDAKHRRNPEVQAVALESCFYELRAIVAHGDTLKGPPARRRHLDAVTMADDVFRHLPSADRREIGMWIRVEQACALCKAGQVKRGVEILDDLRRRQPGAALENRIIDVLGQYAGATDPRAAVAAGDNYSEQGRDLQRAIQFYRQAIAATAKKDDPLLAHAWYRIGWCYYHLDRWHEAVVACEALEKAPWKGTKAGERAAMVKLESLEKLSEVSKSAADAKAAADFLLWVSAAYPGDVVKRIAALRLEKEKKYLEAADQWAFIARNPASGCYGDALFCVGYDCYRHVRSTPDAAVARRALESFRAYLDWYAKLKEPDRTSTRDAAGAVQMSMDLLLRERRHAEALALSANVVSRFPAADSMTVMRILRLRIDALLALARLDEAESELGDMRKCFARQNVGVDDLARALHAMARAYEAAAPKAADKAAADALALKAGECWYEYFEKSSAPVGEQLEAVAGKFFAVAEQKMDAAVRDGDPAQIKDAATLFDRSRALYEQLLARLVPGSETALAVQRRIARCHTRTGRHNDAIRIWDEVTARDERKERLHDWEAWADALAAATEPSRERVDRIRKAIQEYAYWEDLLRQAGRTDENCWRLMYKRAQAMYEVDLEGLTRFFLVMDQRGYSRSWDPRFEELRKRLKERIGR